MTRRLLLCALLLVPSVTFAAAPVAVAKVPATVRAGTTVRVDTTGSVTDSPPLVRVWSGPDQGESHYDGNGKLIGYELTKPGGYVFISVASGKGADGQPSYAATYVQTTVTADAPAPTPTPTPSPQDAPFTAAYKTYVGGMSAALASAGDDLASGRTTTKQQFLDTLHQHSVPFAAAVDALFAPYVDSTGKVTNPAVVAGSVRAAAGVP